MEQQSNLPGQSDASSAKQAILTYEDYYGIDDGVAGGALGGRNLSDKGKISFEQFVAQTSSENIFDNDVSLRCWLIIFRLAARTIVQVLGISWG